jgi:galactokinase
MTNDGGSANFSRRHRDPPTRDRPPLKTSADVTALFAKAFKTTPSVVASAPGRVNLIGEHTDYNGGEVLPIAIAHRTWVAARRVETENESTAVSESHDAVGHWTSTSPERSGEWWDYVSGVTSRFIARGVFPFPMQIAVASDVPAGAGLSSSAALEVATAIAYSALARSTLPARDVAGIAHEAETQFVGVGCGIMDQYASALTRKGFALHLNCDTGAHDDVPMPASVLIFDTATHRSLRQSAYNTRRAECEEALEILKQRNPRIRNLAEPTPDEIRTAGLPTVLENRALHVSQETRRVRVFVGSLRNGGRVRGDLLYESHRSLQSLYDCSSPELDWFVEHAAATADVAGARLTGSGWGGCAIAVGARDALERFAQSITGAYAARFRLTPRSWVTDAAPGARLESVAR